MSGFIDRKGMDLLMNGFIDLLNSYQTKKTKKSIQIVMKTLSGCLSFIFHCQEICLLSYHPPPPPPAPVSEQRGGLCPN